jgi:hypothetical protein
VSRLTKRRCEETITFLYLNGLQIGQDLLDKRATSEKELRFAREELDKAENETFKPGGVQ